MTIHLFPIRHHGPGSARSLEQALAQLQPDIVLVEGPADADAVLPFLTREEMEPPVALLAYVKDDGVQAAGVDLVNLQDDDRPREGRAAALRFA